MTLDMNAIPSWWRRWAVALLRHGAAVMPGVQSTWAKAMRRELDYIRDDPAALRWALGCVLASYRARLAHRPRASRIGAPRQLAIGGALMLLVGVALQDRAGGQTAPPQPAVDGRTCDWPAASADAGSNRIVSARRHRDNADADRSSDCADPASKTPEIPSGQ